MCAEGHLRNLNVYRGAPEENNGLGCLMHCTSIAKVTITSIPCKTTLTYYMLLGRGPSIMSVPPLLSLPSIPKVPSVSVSPISVWHRHQCQCYWQYLCQFCGYHCPIPSVTVPVVPLVPVAVPVTMSVLLLPEPSVPVAVLCQ